MMKFQNFCRTPSQPRLPAPFSPAVGQNSKDVLFASLSRFRKGVTRPPCPKTPGGDRFGRNPLFRGPGLTPRAPGSKLPAQKLLARSLVDPKNLTTIWPLGQKLFHIVAVTDRQTDRQTHILNPPWPLRKKNFFNYFMHGGNGKLWTCKISTISLREVRFAHFTRVG